jgi:hypothetical protein
MATQSLFENLPYLDDRVMAIRMAPGGQDRFDVALVCGPFGNEGAMMSVKVSRRRPAGDQVMWPRS